MARNWEDTLRSWVKPPSENEDNKCKRTEGQIRDALKASSALKSFDYHVYAKGSYANNTNVRLDYDIDIAVECDDFFRYDLIGLAAGEKNEKVKAAITPYSGPGVQEFKAAIRIALQETFGEKAVTPGKIAYRIRERNLTLPADVVPCVTYCEIRDIDSRNQLTYRQGTKLFPTTGPPINNWPQQQLERGTEKNETTSHRYKRMVRALKWLQSELIEGGLLSEERPSFLIECLVFNVPNKYFNHDKYVGDMRGVLASIFNATLTDDACKDWVEVNDVKYLFHSSQPWTRIQAHGLASAAWNHMGLA